MSKILRLIAEILIEMLNDKYDPNFYDRWVKNQKRINKLKEYLNGNH